MRRRNKTSKSWGAAGIAQHEAIGFLDREREAARVKEAIAKRHSMMISGAADMGKTALVQHVVRGLPQDAGCRCLYLAGFKDLQDLFRKLLRALYQDRNMDLRRQWHAEGISGTNFEAWLKAMPSPRLKGTLYRAAERSDCRIILDHVPPLTHAIAKVVKELSWMRDTPVYLLVRDSAEDRIDQLCRFFYWGCRERLALHPLPKAAAAEMLDRCVRRFRLARFDSDKFREEVLELSGCVPGAILKMCAMAADRRYQDGPRIKTKLVHIDYLMCGSSLPRGFARRSH